MAIAQTKTSLHSRYYAEACNEWLGKRLGDTASKKRRSGSEPLATLYPI